MPTSPLSESPSKPAKRPVAVCCTGVGKTIRFELGAQDATVIRTGCTKADVSAALTWFGKHARRLAKNPPTESGGQLIRKLRNGTLKA